MFVNIKKENKLQKVQQCKRVHRQKNAKNTIAINTVLGSLK